MATRDEAVKLIEAMRDRLAQNGLTSDLATAYSNQLTDVLDAINPRQQQPQQGPPAGQDFRQQYAQAYDPQRSGSGPSSPSYQEQQRPSQPWNPPSHDWPTGPVGQGAQGQTGSASPNSGQQESDRR